MLTRKCHLNVSGYLAAVAALACALGVGCQPRGHELEARFVRTIPWAQTGVWLKADTHVHTTFSDGETDLGEVVDRSAAHGCQVIAITDHADAQTAASDEFFAALEQSRKAHPEMVILAGMEWNVPPWGGTEHATLLVPTSAPERKLLRDFQVLFDDAKRGGRDPELPLQALDWLSRQATGGRSQPLVIYNHPCRKRASPGELVELLAAWREASGLAIGFEGGPGHQAASPVGDYKHLLETIDRWDPMAAEVGGAWDQLLARGLPVWGAVATSDFHRREGEQADFWPGEFSETWLYAQDATADSAMEALRVGSFFGVHGHIARAVQLRVLAAGLSREAMSGEAIETAPGSELIVTLHLETPLVDWEGEPNRIDEVDLIAVAAGEARVVARRMPTSESALRVVLLVPEGGVTLRARGRREVINGPDLMFYTNPIQVFADGASAPAAALNLGQAGATKVRFAGNSPPAVSTAAAPHGTDTRRVPAWIPLGFIVAASLLASLVDHWQLAIRRRLAALAPENSITDQPVAEAMYVIPRGWRRYFVALLLAVVFLAVYGSLVPLAPAVMDWPTAAARFQAIIQQPVSFASRSDWATNVLLFVPIGFLGMGLILGARPGDWRRGAGVVLVVLASAALSLAIEFAQLWVAERTSSQNDVVAETLGSLVGAALWLLFGPVLIAWLGRVLNASRPRQRVEHALEAYLALVVLYMLLPLNLTLRPAELLEKLDDGRINLLPLADVFAKPETAIQHIGDMLLFVPLGMLVALWRWPVWERVRPAGPSLSAGLVVVAAIEAAQLFVASRYSSTTDVVTGGLAVAIGWLFAHWLVRENASRQRDGVPNKRYSPLLMTATVANALLVSGVLCLPFERLASADEASERFGQLFLRPPFEQVYEGDPIHAAIQLLYKVILAAPLGSLTYLSLSFRSMDASGQRKRAAFALIMLGLWACVTECVQVLLIGHNCDLFELLILALASGVGFTAAARLAAPNRAHPFGVGSESIC